MWVIADLCIVPMGVGVSVSKYVAACEEILAEAGLNPHLHAYGTNVEGEWDTVFAAVRRCHEAIHKMAWETFERCTEVARKLKLYGAGQDLLSDAFSGNIMGMGPYDLAGPGWDDIKMDVAEKMINGLSETAIPGMADHVTVLEVSTPLDFERRLLNPKGAIYGLSMDLPNQSVFRPAAKSKSIKGLYLTGASTHPGGGVPSAIASGLIASRLIDKHE